ncbi:hypothetical protein Y1Q_0013434 [Alligator mississippiensis]|uniref:Uncharacterized protein n=1 Tax=Alligator mississippiensis TaxID=8496 RepID=A0A151MSB0_ALLMI|nr:hypothetical protein Y1Q_0013434 [Alligator mississippiensis]
MCPGLDLAHKKPHSPDMIQGSLATGSCATKETGLKLCGWVLAVCGWLGGLEILSKLTGSEIKEKRPHQEPVEKTATELASKKRLKFDCTKWAWIVVFEQNNTFSQLPYHLLLSYRCNLTEVGGKRGIKVKWIPFSPTNLVYAEGVTMELDSSEILKILFLVLLSVLKLTGWICIPLSILDPDASLWEPAQHAEPVLFHGACLKLQFQ